MEQTADNTLPTDQSVRVLPDLPATAAEQNDTQPKSIFNHAARLGDKLIDAVEFNLDAAIRKANNPDTVMQRSASNSASFLPPAIQSAYERNRVFFFAVIAAVLTFVLVKFLRR